MAGALGLAALLALMNLIGFAAMAQDKRRAERGLWRWPERLLLRIAFWGGSLGTVLAQRHLRHKTRKQPFARHLKVIVLTQAVLVGACQAPIMAAGGSMPLDYAILIVAAVYLVVGLGYVEWIHRPRKPDQTADDPAPKDKNCS